MTEEEKKVGESGTHTDNNLEEVKEIMEDNNLPTFYSTKQKIGDEEEEDDDTDKEKKP
jgi:hypothetical protein